MSEGLIAKAQDVLRLNDRGSYTVPTSGLYPFQWNWDSCLSALGFAHFDEGRAWTEIDTLFAHQWEDGMVPHIVFHEPDDGYFPGPEIWRTGRAVPTTGITQPPVAGFCVRRLFRGSRDVTIRLTGMPRSSVFQPRASNPSRAATRSTQTLRIDRRRRSTSGIYGSYSTSAGWGGTIRNCTMLRRSGLLIRASMRS
jgi:hypothetical protein